MYITSIEVAYPQTVPKWCSGHSYAGNYVVIGHGLWYCIETVSTKMQGTQKYCMLLYTNVGSRSAAIAYLTCIPL